jgi:PAS domain-containing protein
VPSPADAAREDVVRTIIALERSCLDADAAIVERRWDDVGTAFRTQAALTEELAGLFEAAPDAGPAADAKVAQRVQGIVAYRDDQLRRLQGYHAEVGTRLDSIGRVNAFARTLGKSANSARLLDGQY